MIRDFLAIGAKCSTQLWVWVGIFVVLLLQRALNTFRMYHNRPRKVTLGGSTLAIGKWLSSIRYITSATKMINAIYSKRNGQAFAIPSLAEYQVLVSSEQHIKELDEAPESLLSFHAAMVDRLQHKYTMYGFEHNDVDPHNAIPVRTLKVLLRMNLPSLIPALQPRIENAFKQAIASGKLSGSLNEGGWKIISTFSLARFVTGQINNQVLLGNEFADNAEFTKAAISYNEDVVVAMELCRQIPTFLVPLVAPTIMAWSGSMKKVGKLLQMEIERRLEMGSTQGKPGEPYVDCIQWIIESSHTQKQRSTTRLVQQTIALLFASAHQMPMALVYAIYCLCTHPEYITALREEITQGAIKGVSHENLPLLDAFLRESARMNPLDALSIQRKAMAPYRFSDGVFLPAGNLVAVPQQAMMRDPKIYVDPDIFDPSRHLVAEDDLAKTKLTDVKWSFPYWGGPKRACPARWYVSAALKQVLVHFITKYDFQIENDNAPRTFTWTTALVPRLGTNILVRDRTIVGT